MNIVEKDVGEKIDYSVNGTKLNIRRCILPSISDKKVICDMLYLSIIPSTVPN